MRRPPIPGLDRVLAADALEGINYLRELRVEPGRRTSRGYTGRPLDGLNEMASVSLRNVEEALTAYYKEEGWDESMRTEALDTNDLGEPADVGLVMDPPVLESPMTTPSMGRSGSFEVSATAVPSEENPPGGPNSGDTPKPRRNKRPLREIVSPSPEAVGEHLISLVEEGSDDGGEEEEDLAIKPSGRGPPRRITSDSEDSLIVIGLAPSPPRLSPQRKTRALRERDKQGKFKKRSPTSAEALATTSRPKKKAKCVNSSPEPGTGDSHPDPSVDLTETPDGSHSPLVRRITRAVKKREQEKGTEEEEEELAELPKLDTELLAIRGAQSTTLLSLGLDKLGLLEDLRSRSKNLQGGVSGKMRIQIAVVTEIVRDLAHRVEQKGDLMWLRRQLRDVKEDRDKTRDRELQLQRRVRGLEDRLAKLEAAQNCDSGVRASVASGGRPGSVVSGFSLPSLRGVAESVVVEPDVSALLADRRFAFDGAGNPRIIGVQTGDRVIDSPLVGRGVPRIIEDIQLVPPSGRLPPGSGGVISRGSGASAALDSIPADGATWRVSMSRSAKRRARRKRKALSDGIGAGVLPGPGGPATPARGGPPLKGTPAKSGTVADRGSRSRRASSSRGASGPGLGRRPPRTAAVGLKGRGETFSYAEALLKARGEVSLNELGVEALRIRRAANGGRILEIPGPDGPARADLLAAKLREVLGDSATVTRPIARGELRLIGLDDSVTTGKVTEVVADEGGCEVSDIRTGPIRQMFNGMGSVWVQCPLVAALKLARLGSVRVGWVSARVILLKARPIQCFKCWGYGHGNVNHSLPAQDLLVQEAARLGAALCFVSEPRVVPASQHWLGSGSGRSALFWRPGALPGGCRLVDRGRDFVAADCGEFYAVSAYFPPRGGIAAFLGRLDGLRGALSGLRGRRVLLCGDFNARSWLWDPRRENRRGEVLSEWAAEMDLRLLNVGGVSTCVRPQGVSVVDLSWVSPGLAGRVTGWSVLEGVETLSDHLYIKFGILPSGSTGGGGEGHSGVYPRWDFSKLRPDDLTASLEERCAFGPGEAQAATAEGLAGWVSQTMARACDDSAPRSRFCRVGGGRRASSVYWWTEEIAGLRRACLRARRSFTRCRRRGSRMYCECCAVFRLAKRDLRKAIIAAKIRAWEDLVRSVEEDPWGLPYKLVLKRLRRSSPALTETLGEDELAEMLDSLFPRPPERDWVEPRREFAWDPSWACDEGEVLEALKGKARAGNPAPGPDGIPAGIWRRAPMALTRIITRLFNRCLMEGIFPAAWRRARLVLIPKGGAEPAGPLRARPICLLNEIGKIFERVLVGRVERWMADHPSASLSDSQYGFRAGRSTVDALLRVRDFVSRAVQGGGAAVAVGLDVVNAFNSVPRSRILQALWEKGLPLYLRRVVGSYLSERTVDFPVRGGGVRSRDVVAGVPQGSVLGPLLWNVVYDRVLNARLEPGCEVICYADDTLVLAAGPSVEWASVRATFQVTYTVGSIAGLGLRVSAGKTVAAMFHGRRARGRAPPVEVFVRVGDDYVEVRDSMKYLGVILDSRMSFRLHFEYVRTKVATIARALGRLMPNMRGPGEARRRLYATVMMSVVLYGAPVWVEAFAATQRAQVDLRRIQRQIALRVVSGYRTVSYVAATLLARMPPVDISAASRRRMYERARDLRPYGLWTSEAVAEARAAEELLVRRQWLLQLWAPGLPSVRVRDAILPSLTSGWIVRIVAA
ncbi:uncharacterized protein LOC112588883 [Harpegnathos saltator]|uniref:uncharacterized protein LOC112588883 n=1 Tax=Harpegnathos saltator TaxID=610380 RepID=UPI000DBEDF43|nr:uncharacterized protein LOC112588883 [Harpegnathos saltator]